MKVEIHPYAMEQVDEAGGPYNWDTLPQVIGLNAKTIEKLQDGGLHKVETVFQLELAIGCWETEFTDQIADGELYVDPSQLASVTAYRPFRGLRIYAIALSSNGLVKLITDSAKKRIKFCLSEATDEDLSKRQARELAFENYLYNQAQVSEKKGSDYASPEGFNTRYKFTIDDEAKPLTKTQSNYVRQLDECINDLIAYARSAKIRSSGSLVAELEADNGDKIRKRFLDTVARLKRVNINVLAYEKQIQTAVFDSSYYEPPESEQTIHGPDSEYYLFTYWANVVHIILAPAPYLRVPFPLEKSVDWEPAPMWGSKHVGDGENLDFVDHKLGSGLGHEDIQNTNESGSNKVVALVPSTNAQSDEND